MRPRTRGICMRHRGFDSTGGHDTTTPVVYGHKSVAAR
nr:MAG TPA: hypothetical protein [Caudoviricetes sp.]